jgi:methionyl-tRNA synthetase
MVLMKKYYESVVPEPNEYCAVDTETLEKLATAPLKIGKLIDQYKFRAACQEMMQLARSGNKYLADEEPWKLVKTNPQRVATIMHTALQIAAGLAILSEPFLPHTAQKLREMLKLDEAVCWDSLKDEIPIRSHHTLGETSLLFEKIEDEEIAAQLEKLTA